MKKILLVVVIVLLASAILSIETGWRYGNVVDDFGDNTGEKFLMNVDIGRFSNKFTYSSDVLFRVAIQPEYMTIILFEYSEYQVNFYKTKHVDIKIKIDNEEPYSIKGFVFENSLSIIGPQSDSLIEGFKRASCVKLFIVHKSSRYNLSIDCNGFTSKYNQLYKQNKKGE